MKKYKPLIFAIAMLVIAYCGTLCYRNLYLKSLTEDNLSVLLHSLKDGKIRDYHNTIGVKDKNDVWYEYNAVMRLYIVRYGNYTLYLSAEKENSWSIYDLEEYLNMIGISFELKEPHAIFYYYGEELSIRD